MPVYSTNRRTENTICYLSEKSDDATAPSYTFYPTMADIENFPRMIERIEQETSAGSRCGIIKIVPPEGWKPRKQGYTNKHIGHTQISRPVIETFSSATRQKCYTKDVSVYKPKWTWNELQTYATKNKLLLPKETLKNRREVDRLLWDSMLKENAPEPIYGADTEGSLYDDDVKTLNMSHLGTILDDIKHTRMPGVTTTYLYFGMWRTMFPWHAEDVDLYSINYLHHGASKNWWAVPPEAADLFERMMHQLFREDAEMCSAFLRHKNFIVHPEILTRNGIPFSMTTQEKGQFIVTFPRGYHMGYNTGNNVAESTNFASNRWVDFGMNYVPCQCKKDSVIIDVDSFVSKYREENLYEKWSRYWGSITTDGSRKKAIAQGKYCLNLNDWMYSNHENNLYEEKQHNERRSKHFPHCAICEPFLPTACCRYSGDIPSKSRRFVTFNLFTKRDEESVFDSEEDVERKRKEKLMIMGEEGGGGTQLTPDHPITDPIESTILVCQNCKVSVHEDCYAKREAYDDRDENTPWKCVRCCERDETIIRTASCVLCELRGGALVRAVLGSTPSYVHVFCALAHRRSFFIDPLHRRDRVYIQPPPKYGENERYMRKLSEAAYRDVPRPWDSIANRYRCQICDSLGEGLMVCKTCAMEEDKDADIVHSTCARAVGMRVERRTFPDLVVVFCHKHEDEERRKSKLDVGMEVEVDEEESEEKRRGRVVGYVEEEGEDASRNTLCSVEFENYEESFTTEESDIVECWCDNCDGKTHAVDSPILVLWNDGKKYPAYYRGPAPPSKYAIQFSGREGRTEIIPFERVRLYEPQLDDISLPSPAKKPKKSRRSLYRL
ncbi:hypothetical protein PMAYCL1PPCAC_06745 [Pristionchus mayeri]|uniref:[Histone H3]-trimethyl-L-lysine(9) demethylase n=1 Tax=Pristionchus mayeri TaxID=1317129 RepID=A0AAN4ZF65_9BILA|nr:hypothetical protein PMAYCL1PPCAC_06745 [Pristionchus mayeri]